MSPHENPLCHECREAIQAGHLFVIRQVDYCRPCAVEKLAGIQAAHSEDLP